VPINTKHCEDFDPLAVPTVTDLLREIDEWTGPEDGEKDGKSIQDWEKTSLRPHVEYFRSFVTGIMRDEMEVKAKREVDAMEF
jgi:DNA primase small subunit